MKPPFSDPEKAAEAGRVSQERRAARKKLEADDPEEAIRQTFEGERVALTRLLLDAAYGRRSFAGEATCEECGSSVPVPSLAPDKRLAAITKSLEYAVGRPAARDKPAPAPDAPQAGLVIE